MTRLPPELTDLAAMLDNLPPAAQAAFQYCLVLMMVESGVAELIQTLAGDGWPLCTFRTNAGDVFTISKPPLSPAEEAAVLATIREILQEDEEDSVE